MTKTEMERNMKGNLLIDNIMKMPKAQQDQMAVLMDMLLTADERQHEQIVKIISTMVNPGVHGSGSRCLDMLTQGTSTVLS